jgi:uncharacterized membrane protein YdbT with pleckstrin-like domain
MGYIENNLVQGETVLYRARISWGIFILPALLSAVLIWLATKIHPIAVFLVVLFVVIIFLRLFLLMLATQFALTNLRIIAKRGLIQQHSIEILLNKVESISISQPLVGLIFGYGTVTVIGSGGTHETFKLISHPNELRKRVNGQIATIEQNR